MVSTNVSKILPELVTLNKQEKLHIIQFLVSDIAQAELYSITPNLSYPVWSPHFAESAANQLLELLHSEQENI